MRKVLYVYDFSVKAYVAFEVFCTNIKKHLHKDSYKISARDMSVIILFGEPVCYQFRYIGRKKDLCKFMGLAVHEVVFDEGSRFEPEVVQFFKTKERLK